MPVQLKAVIKDYLLNSSFHGLRFVADHERHMTERIFWLICVLLSWYGSGLLIIASWDAFQNNAISFVMETNYLDWDTKFPAIGICENANEDRVYEIADRIWTVTHDVSLDEVLKELSYFRGITFYTLQTCDKKDADVLCPKSNFSYYANLVRSPCEKSVKNCAYNGKKFDCCEYFEEIETDMGRCYIINSIQSKKTKKSKRYDTTNNKKKQLGFFQMEVMIPATIYILGEEEVPTLTTLQSDLFQIEGNILFRRHIAIRDIENDPDTRQTTPLQRSCRFEDENYLNVYPYYSYSACTVQCRKDQQKKRCNCSDHFMPNTPEKDKCNLEGMVCLNKFYNELSVLKPEWARRSGLSCNCLPSCTEVDITVIKDDKIPSAESSSFVEIQMEYLPNEKFKRNVVRGRLDLVVSTGGTTGLFVGASLLSFVEIVYYLTIRYYGTYYMEKKNKNNGVKTSDIRENTPIVHFISDRQMFPIIDIKRTRSSLHKLTLINKNRVDHNT